MLSNCQPDVLRRTLNCSLRLVCKHVTKAHTLLLDFPQVKLPRTFAMLNRAIADFSVRPMRSSIQAQGNINALFGTSKPTRHGNQYLRVILFKYS